MAATRTLATASDLNGLVEGSDEYVIRIPTGALRFRSFTNWCRTPTFPRICRISYIDQAMWLTDWPGVNDAIVVPASAATLDGFSDWSASADFPRSGRISFIDREIILDMSPEELQTHNLVKGAITVTVGQQVAVEQSGMLFPDGARIRNKRGLVSNEPDCMFVSWQSLRNKRVRLVPRKKHRGQFAEIYGSPDWVLEILSDSSVAKDTRQLKRAYFRAGIEEYWPIDARGEQIDFRILHRGAKGYIAVATRDGWQRSRVFGRNFKLERQRHPLGPWVYTLHAKP